MCGHVGVLSRNMMKRHLDFFEQALYADMFRGEDGTGVAFINEKFDVSQMKKAIGAKDFIDLTPYSRMMKSKGLSSKFIMGHNRWATRGGVSNDTSHPFHYGDIIMAHNGSLRAQWRLPDDIDFSVDSENIAHSLSKIGVAPTIELLEGSYSLVWADTKKQTVNFIRNKERPMYFGLTKDKKTILYASEKLMLEWIAWRNNIDMDQIVASEVDTLYTFDMGEKKDGILTPNKKAMDGYKFVASDKITYLPARSKGNLSVAQKKSDKLLDDIKLSAGQNLEFSVASFEPYASPKHTQRGVLRGYMTDDPYLDVVMHGVNNTQIQVQTGDLFTAPVIAAQPVKGVYPEEIDLLILNGQDVVEVLDLAAYAGLNNVDDDEDAPIYAGPLSKVSYSEWLNLTKHGCSQCVSNLEHSDHNLILWVDSFTPLCPDCSDKMSAPSKKH